MRAIPSQELGAGETFAGAWGAGETLPGAWAAGRTFAWALSCRINPLRALARQTQGKN